MYWRSTLSWMVFSNAPGHPPYAAWGIYATIQALGGEDVYKRQLLDTRKSSKDLTGTFVADLVLQILSYVAQTERENTRQRQREGIAAARQRGVQFGRPRKPIPESFPQVREAWEMQRIASREAAQMPVSYTHLKQKPVEK